MEVAIIGKQPEIIRTIISGNIQTPKTKDWNMFCCGGSIDMIQKWFDIAKGWESWGVLGVLLWWWGQKVPEKLRIDIKHFVVKNLSSRCDLSVEELKGINELRRNLELPLLKVPEVKEDPKPVFKSAKERKQEKKMLKNERKKKKKEKNKRKKSKKKDKKKKQEFYMMRTKKSYEN